jgi:hypothetical protein
MQVTILAAEPRIAGANAKDSVSVASGVALAVEMAPGLCMWGAGKYELLGEAERVEPCASMPPSASGQVSLVRALLERRTAFSSICLTVFSQKTSRRMRWEL